MTNVQNRVRLVLVIGHFIISHYLEQLE